jgi:hypothetical protein
MEKIVFFGDSYMYGHGLADCLDKNGYGPGPEPSKLGWANLLCEMRNASGRNISIPGASNLEILWKMLNTKIDSDEIIIVQWSFWNRDCLLHDNEIAPVGIWREDSKMYYRVHSNSDMIKRNYLNINHGHLWLKQKSNSFLMLGNEKNYKEIDNTDEGWKHFAKLTDDMISPYFSHVWCDIAEDNVHAGPKTNARWAKFVNQLLDSKLKG